jgi:hypothetical protein
MTHIRRRSWVSSRQTRRDGLRLSTMIVLLVVVLVLMFTASRPQIWVQLVPGLDTKPPAKAPDSPIEIAPPAPKQTPTPGPRSDQTPLRLMALIILAVVYFGWRFARMGRALSRNRPPKRDRPPVPDSPPPEEDVA